MYLHGQCDISTSLLSAFANDKNVTPEIELGVFYIIEKVETRMYFLEIQDLVSTGILLHNMTHS